ncbi:MAG: ferrous iron transport protein A [Firmicutes bacterium]|nr:ferrous iron transport protein A [Bacillota bacterium]
MAQKQKISLSSMKNGQSGIIMEIDGGKGMLARLEALGVRTGSRIIKKSGFFGAGPVIVTAGNTDVAIGHGMASRIMVEVDSL